MFNMKLQGIWGAVVILSTDFLFVYAVEFLKSAEKLRFGQEMDLTFVESEAKQTPLAHLISFIAVIIGITADNYGWSFKLSAVGILFAFFSSCQVLSQALFGIPKGRLSKIATSCYVTTSMVRSVIIIGQVTLPTGIGKIRPYIFVMIYSRMIATGLSRLNIFRLFHCWFSFLFTFFYLIFFYFGLRRVMNYETPYVGIVSKAFTFLLSKYANKIYSYCPFKPKEAKENVPTLAPSKRNIIEPEKKKFSKVEYLGDIVLPSEEQLKLLEQKGFEASQGQKFCKIFPIVLFGVFFSILHYYVVSVTTYQAEYVKSVQFEQWGKVGIGWFLILSKIVAYVVTEYFFLPTLRKRFKTDLLHFAFGYFLLVLAYLMSVYIQFTAIQTVDYAIPKNNQVQLRIYNAMDYKITAHINSLDIKVDIEPFNLKHVKITPYKRKYELSVQGKEKSINFTMENMKEMSTRSMIYREEKISFPLQEDPKISEIKGDHYFAYCQFHMLGLNKENVKFISTNDSTVFSVMVSATDLKAFAPSGYDTNGSLNNLKSGVLYSTLLSSTDNELHMFYLEGPNPISMVHLLPQVVLESVASAIATPSFFRFLYTEGPSKMRCTAFTIFTSVGFFLLHCATSEAVVSYAHGDDNEMLFFAFFHILALLLVVLIDKQYPYDFPNYYQITL